MRYQYTYPSYSGAHVYVPVSRELYDARCTVGSAAPAPAPELEKRKSPRAGCCCLSLEGARVCDLLGAVMSACLLLLVCVYWWAVKPGQRVEIWDENIMLLNSGTVVDLMQTSIAESCPRAAGTYEVQKSGFNFDGDANVVVPFSIHRYTLVVWPFLGAVFFFSLLFQAPRTWHTLLWYTCGDPKGDPNGDAYVAREEQPDFERWAEYALTSPFQVFVIATSFWIGEMDLLLCLCALQGAFMFMGYALELEINVVLARLYAPCADSRLREYEWFYEVYGGPPVWYSTPDAHTQRQSEEHVPSLWKRWGLLTRAVFLFLSACFFHGVVWWVIIHRFYSQASNASACNNPMPDEIRSLVEAIVMVEFVFFSLFGFVVLWQLMRVVDKVNAQELPSEQQRLDFHSRLWLQGTACYHCLSFSAKFLLGVLFIALVERMPSATDTRIAPLV